MSFVTYIKKVFLLLFKVMAISYYYVVFSNKFYFYKLYIRMRKSKIKHFENYSNLFFNEKSIIIISLVTTVKFQNFVNKINFHIIRSSLVISIKVIIIILLLESTKA